jgi:hypothetical protein
VIGGGANRGRAHGGQRQLPEMMRGPHAARSAADILIGSGNSSPDRKAIGR